MGRGFNPAYAALWQLVDAQLIIRILCRCGHQAEMHPRGLRRRVGDRYLRDVKFRCTFCGALYPLFEVRPDDTDRSEEKQLR